MRLVQPQPAQFLLAKPVNGLDCTPADPAGNGLPSAAPPSALHPAHSGVAPQQLNEVAAEQQALSPGEPKSGSISVGQALDLCRAQTSHQPGTTESASHPVGQVDQCHACMSHQPGSIEGGKSPAPACEFQEADDEQLPKSPTGNPVGQHGKFPGPTQSSEQQVPSEHDFSRHVKQGSAAQCRQDSPILHPATEHHQPRRLSQKRAAAVVAGDASGSNQHENLEPDAKRIHSFQREGTAEDGQSRGLAGRPQGEAEGEAARAAAKAEAAQAAAACGGQLWDTVGAVCCDASGMKQACVL